MSVDEIVSWGLENQEVVSLFALIATATGALYQPLRDLLRALPRLLWNIARLAFWVVWSLAWPLRKIIWLIYMKFFAQHVDSLFDRIFDWFENREDRKEAWLQ